MIGKQKILALIPARGGSKLLPRKNVLELNQKPLIAWTIEAASRSGYLDRCIVSTDDPEIARVAKDWGGDVPFERPAELARDETPTLDVALHAVDTLPGYDILVILQPTSPLRTTGDIDETIEAMASLQAPSAVSVFEPAKSPYWAYRTDECGRLCPLLDQELATRRRQELPSAYLLNGAVYVARIDWLRKEQRFVSNETVPHIMPPERSLDVDTGFDLELAGFYLRHSREHTRQPGNPGAANTQGNRHVGTRH